MSVSNAVSQNLKAAGLVWKPQTHDFFSIPDVGMDEHIFVLANMMAGIEVLRGHQAITFNGAVEWALDYVWTSEAVWRPTESQIREQLLKKLPANARFALWHDNNRYTIELYIGEAPRVFHAASAADAYAQAWLSLHKNG